MDIVQTFELDTLLSLNESGLYNLKGARVSILKIDGTKIDGIITGFGLATNNPHLICSFKIDQSYINLLSIKTIQVYKSH